MPPCPVKRHTLLSLPKNGKRRFFKTAVRYVHWAYLTTRRNNGFFINRLTAGTPSSYSISANFGPTWPEVLARLTQYKNALLDKIQSGVLKIGIEIYTAVSGIAGTTK